MIGSAGAEVIYRVLFFDGDGRKAGHERTIDCANDDDALERVAMLRHPHMLEIWEAERLVWRFESRV